LNLLRADQKEGGSYLATLGETRTGQMLVSSTADGPRGAGTALQMASGAVYSLADGKVSNGMLNGTKGTLLLSKNGNEALTFVPDSVGSSKVVVLSTAKATELTDTTGTKYVMDNDTGVYYNGKESVWSEVYSWLNAGTSLTLYLDAGGGVDYVFVGGGGTTSNEAVIIYEKGSTSGFSSLAGGTSGYAIYKNGLPATAGDMRKYDVATYSSTTNSIRVCDTRITGYYEDCYPNPKEPTKITVLGYEFNVLPTAMQTVSQFKPGDQITLLLTEDNQVAGAVAASGNLPYNQTQLAREGLGIYLVIRLDCAYDGLRFVPLSPPLESGTVLAWKKTEVLSATAAALLRFAEKYVGGISDHPV